MDWKADYLKKLLKPEEAAAMIKSGERVMVAGGSTDQPLILKQALFDRRNELRGVSIYHLCPRTEPGWLEPGHEDAFRVDITGFISPVGRPSVTERRTGFIPQAWDMTIKDLERPDEHIPIDWNLVTVSPPNRNGFCSLGPFLWFKKDYIHKSKRTIAQVDENIRWVYGDTTVHVSEIDYFVEYTPEVINDEDLPSILADVDDVEKRNKIEEYARQILPHMRPVYISMFKALDIADINSYADTLGLLPPPEAEPIARHINTLIKHRDTFQIGQGSPSAYLCRFGAFEGKEDLGYHAEMTARGVGNMIKQGQINGKYKNVFPNKAIFSSLDGMGPEEFEYATENPKIEVHPTRWVTSIPVVASNDNMVSIQNGISVDLTGQINAETIFGGMLLNGPGGQPPSHIGAVYSRGGRAITVMRSTAVKGAVSCIVPQFEPGTVVTVPRAYADYIVTEYGIARLMGKSLRERSEALIAIAHPEHQAELKKEANRLFWP